MHVIKLLMPVRSSCRCNVLTTRVGELIVYLRYVPPPAQYRQPHAHAHTKRCNMQWLSESTNATLGPKPGNCSTVARWAVTCNTAGQQPIMLAGPSYLDHDAHLGLVSFLSDIQELRRSANPG
jgi:hypothetical protein